MGCGLFVLLFSISTLAQMEMEMENEDLEMCYIDDSMDVQVAVCDLIAQFDKLEMDGMGNMDHGPQCSDCIEHIPTDSCPKPEDCDDVTPLKCDDCMAGMAMPGCPDPDVCFNLKEDGWCDDCMDGMFMSSCPYPEYCDGSIVSLGHGTSFYLGLNSQILFDGWTTTNEWQYALSWIAIFLIGILREFLVTLRKLRHHDPFATHFALLAGSRDEQKKFQEDVEMAEVKKPDPEDGPSSNGEVKSKETLGFSRMSCCSLHNPWADHLLDSFLYVLNVFVGYCLMLVFMTYNTGLCIAVLLGGFFGYFFFGASAQNEVVEADHCIGS